MKINLEDYPPNDNRFVFEGIFISTNEIISNNKIYKMNADIANEYNLISGRTYKFIGKPESENVSLLQSTKDFYLKIFASFIS